MDWIPVGAVRAAGNFPRENLPFGKFPEKRYNSAGNFPGTRGINPVREVKEV